MSLQTLDKLIQSGIKLTPMMKQYYDIKKNYPDTFLLFRMGDFYELFFEDAVQVSKVLNITLTHRGKLGDISIPMAGIPHHAANAYIDRITTLGLKAAICEQIENPEDAIGIVKRAVTQIVSPGIPYDFEKVNKLENTFLASACRDINSKNFYLTLIDFTTGDFFGLVFNSIDEMIDALKIYRPKEFVATLGQWDDFHQFKEYLKKADLLPTYLSKEYLNPKFTKIYIEKLITHFERDKVLQQNNSSLEALGLLSYYIISTQGDKSFSHISPFKLINNIGKLQITQNTLEGLDILPKVKGDYNNSLIGFIDKTQTAMGQRKLKHFCIAPTTNLDDILARQNFIEYFVKDIDRLKNVRSLLSEIRDIERIMAKISTQKNTPSDIINIGKGIELFQKIQTALKDLPVDLQQLLPQISIEEDANLELLSKVIETSINDEIGASIEKGNLIKNNINAERDRLKNLSNNWSETLNQLEDKYRQASGISKIKIRSNNIFGYYIEVSKGNLDQVPSFFERKQTLVNAERFTTKELKDFEREVLSANDLLNQIDREIIKSIVEEILALAKSIHQVAEQIAILDVLLGLSWCALQENFVRPKISNKKIVNIKGAWHPLIKRNIKDQFITHDIHLDEKKFFGLITGPNMAGKTTVMREVALIQFLTQLGSFTPAQKVEVGICDFIFARIGASDNIIQGQSTFMMEMNECAEIIRHATDRSLIILDEVGRGTSTYDGLSIAWALTEHLAYKTKAITLFATHYHELIELIESMSNAKNFTVEIQDNEGEIHFLYRLIEKWATQSFGIHVAKLAGIPKTILSRAEEILSNLEKENQKDLCPKQLSFWENPSKKNQNDNQDKSKHETLNKEIAKEIEASQELKEIISKIDLMNTTPIQALQILEDLKNKLKF